MGRLNKKVALITGAANGIGRASAILFGAEGASLGLIDIDGERGETLASELRLTGINACFTQADISKKKEVKDAVDNFAHKFNGIDILYNNAGGASARDNHLLDMPLDEFDQAISLNLFGPFVACRYVIPHMEKKGGGSIINTSSIRSQIGTPGADGYTSAKGGVEALTRALAIQCGTKGIRVNAIAPGAVLTERVKLFMEKGNDSGPTESLIKRHILGLGEPEQVASVALFFASDDSSWVTGQILPVDGGVSAN